MALNIQNLDPATPENAAARGRLGGLAKKGSKHITTYIQELMEDETFEANVLDAKKGMVEYKGAPVKAIVQVAITKAINGDAKAMDWLAKYGWSQKVEQDITSKGEKLNGSLDEAALNTRLSALINSAKAGSNSNTRSTTENQGKD